MERKFLIADVVKTSVAAYVEKSGADSVEKSDAAFVEFYCRIQVSIFIVEILCRILLLKYIVCISFISTINMFIYVKFMYICMLYT